MYLDFKPSCGYNKRMMTRQETYEHLLDRHLQPWNYPGLGVDAGVVSFPLYDFSGKRVGYQDYRPFAERNCRNVREARYFTYLPRGVNGYFGTESFLGARMQPDWNVYVVEGVFKAAALHSLGFPALALMGSETARHKQQLDLLPYKFVAVGDNDDAGRKFARNLGGVTSPCDLDEMNPNELLNFVYELEEKYASYYDGESARGDFVQGHLL